MTSFALILVVSSLLAAAATWAVGRLWWSTKVPTTPSLPRFATRRKTDNREISVNGEQWTAPNESGFVGARSSASISSKQVLEEMPKLVTEGMGGQITSTKFVNKLGFAGVENEFDIPKYYALNSIWDSGHADTIMGSFRYSTLKKH